MKRNAIPENVMEHSFEVAAIAYTLAAIRNEFFEGTLDPNQIAVAALFHDVSEVLTGDLPSPIKYHNAKIRDAYKEVERTAEKEMLRTLPTELQSYFKPFVMEDENDSETKAVIKAADMIAAYIKCKAEVNAGNPEFVKAEAYVEERLEEFDNPEVGYFRKTFLPSFDLTLDELITPSEPIINLPNNQSKPSQK